MLTCCTHKCSFAVGVLALTFLSTIASVVQATKAFYPSNVQGTVAQAILNQPSTSLLTVTTTSTKFTAVSASRPSLIADSIIQEVPSSKRLANGSAGDCECSTLETNFSKISNETSLNEGFVREPTGRGTFDILWSSIFTLALCAYTSVHLNAPSTAEREWHTSVRKFRWTLLSATAPELVLAFATGQKSEAKRSVEMWRRNGYTDWTVRHGFFANMGGLELQPLDSPTFPVNAKQLHYLVTRNYIDYPHLDTRDMLDKSKSSKFQKALTGTQITWFLTQLVGRLVQNLPITAIELTTFLSVLCTFFIWYKWDQKPLDIRSPITLKMQSSIADVLKQERTIHGASQPYRQTPLDFVDDLSPSWLVNVQPLLKCRMGPHQRPLPRFTNDRFTPIKPGKMEVLVSLIYPGLYLLGWYTSFPTQVEQFLWQICSFVMVAATVVYWICEIYQDGHRLSRWQRWRLRLFPKHTLQPKSMEQRNKNMEVLPFWEAAVLTPMVILYALARTYLLAEVFLSLRSLPREAFQAVSWANYIPHI